MWQPVLSLESANTSRPFYITPVLSSPNWLPVHDRVTFKTVLLVWRCLHDQTFRYLNLTDFCVPVASVEGRRQLCLATNATSVVLLDPSTGGSTAKCNFANSELRTWNGLLAALRSSDITRHLLIVQVPTQNTPVTLYRSTFTN